MLWCAKKFEIWSAARALFC